MTLAQYHDSLAEYPPVGIILANEGVKEDIVTHQSLFQIPHHTLQSPLALTFSHQEFHL